MAESDQNKELMNELISKQLNSKQGLSPMMTKFEWLVRISASIQILFLACLIYTLTTDGDCDEPIRLWLKVTVICYVMTTAIAVYSCVNLTSKGVKCLKFLLDLFTIIWKIIGVVWFFEDDTCEQKWYTGYVMAYAVVVFFFIYLAVFVLVCTIVIGAICSVKTTKKKNEVVNS